MKHKIQKLDDFLNEDFYNPFDEGNPIETKPSHIADKGGLLRLRKEIFNINRVEYARKNNGNYTVLSKTQYAKGEIVEIAPIIFVGVEAKAVPRLKDYIFEIDKNKQQYGIVLGYGSLYGHSETPNITFAYNKQNRQMYFIAARTINAGEELTINYGKDYWDERNGFGTMAPQEKAGGVSAGEAVAKGETSESMIQPNSEDILQGNTIKTLSTPNNPQNPVITGVAIYGQGQS
jgi:hypothetical protein